MKRRLLIIAIFLLLGAVVNVAVAWGLWLGTREKHIMVKTSMYRSAAQRMWDRYAPKGSPPFDSHLGGSTWCWTGVAAGIDGLFVVQEKVGSPLRALQYGSYYDQPALFYGPTLIPPYKPIWSGFAINTAFYAANLWLLVRGPFALRRFLRLRRGLCLKCAYPMGESSVCTECGITLPRRRPMPTF